METANEIFEENRKKAEAFTKQRLQAEKSQELQEKKEKIELAKKTVEEVIDKNEKKFQETAQEFLVNHERLLINKLMRDLKNAIIDKLMEMKLCPAMTIPDWDCGEDLKMGEEEHCKGANFINCPAFNRYINWRIMKKITTKINYEKMKGNQKRKKEAKKEKL